jgi:hypothetical protein
VENKQEYLDRLKLAIEHLHNCGAHYLRTEPVHEIFKGQTVWKGEVEVFGLSGHPRAKRAYGWIHREGKNDEGERFVAVLEIPPVESPVTAVRASIMADAKASLGKEMAKAESEIAKRKRGQL